MKKIIWVCIFLFLLSNSFSYSAEDKFVLVIDAGHGGRDTGATRGEYKEKSINLGVALALGKLVESNMRDVKVIYTRKTDVFVDLNKRAEIANRAKANLFVSIHTNSTAAKVTTAEGADTYILGLARSEENLAVAKRENSVILLEDDYNRKYEGFDPNSPESYIMFEFMTDKYMEQSLDFATYVQKGFVNVARRKDRGVRQAGFLVLRESAMPSVLIELGFINNAAEAKYLSSNTGQRTMASSIYMGIEKYIKDFNKKQGRVVSVSSNNSGNGQVAHQESVKKGVSERNNNITTHNEKVASTDWTGVASAQNSDTPQNIFLSKNMVVSDLESSSSTSATSTDEIISAPVVKSKRSSNKPSSSAINRNVPADYVEKIDPPVSVVNRSAIKNIYTSGLIEYRVQFLISKYRLPMDSPKFKGLYPVDEYEDGGMYKYTYGLVDNESAALKLRNKIRKQFKDAFVVRFKDRTRIK